ncbi:MAG: hypothetical protein ACXVPL_09435 [Actinomycetota bacterium]
MPGQLHPYTVHLFHQLHDWLYMLGIVAAFAVPEIIAMIRLHRWRRAVLAAFR